MKIPFRHRLWRAMMTVFHRWPIHPGWRHPMRFYDGPGNCILCRHAWQKFSHPRLVEGLLEDAERDRRLVEEWAGTLPESRIEISAPEYDAAGNLKRRGISMSATAQRQIDEIVANDPDAAEALQKAFDEIAREP